MRKSDELEVVEELELVSARIADMNKHITSASVKAHEELRENGELDPDTLETLRHHLRRYDQEREKLDDKVLKLDQLLNP